MKWKDRIILAVAIIGGTWTLISIYSWISAPSVKLTATVEYGDFIMPAGLDSTLKELQDAQRDNKMHALIARQTNITRAVLDSAAVTMTSTKGSPEYFRDIRGYCSVKLRNGRNQELESVGMFVPGARLVQIEREGLPATSDSVNETIQLGRLLPEETLSLVVWSKRSLDYNRTDQIRLWHKGGVGDVKILKRVGATGQFFDSYSGLLLFCFVWPMVVLCLYLVYNQFTKSTTQMPGKTTENSESLTV